jgi:DNA-binding GntR family transcriptional regulator
MGATDLPQLELTSLRQQARAAIHGQIVTGALVPGKVYPVGHFSSQLGVSATPVREALFDLDHEGLVEPVRNRGFRIVELSDHDLDEIFELRVMLEIPAIRLAAGHLTESEGERARYIADKNKGSASQGALEEFLSTDRDYHLALLAPVQNRRLVDQIGRLRDQTRLPGLRSLAETGSLAAAAEEHFLLLNAVESGDADAAASILRDHLLHTRGIWAGRPEESRTPPE